ncbi:MULTISPECIES: response regulator transcription factor [Paenibacillus]|uniref:response regulator transcription factor n=1 Tax=Paenibacillus TaxID=44249 RepID=UPI000420B95C|nr:MULTISPECIES: response regulator transcription factor [Paenibacillus]CDN44758.1 YesN12 [Paenibacillus sp. P22]
MHKVMLVDDEGYARQGLRSMIDWEACGYEVCAEAEDGEEALRMIGEHAPDLVITDIRMPVLSGLELIRSVRGTGNHSVKFIIVSGYGDFSYAQQAIKFGVRDFILKPVDDGEMMEALQGLASQIEKDEQAGERSSRQSRKALESLLRGQSSGEELQRHGELLGLDPEGSCCYLILEANGILSFMGAEQPEQRAGELRLEIAGCAEQLGLTPRPCVLLEHKPGVYGLPVVLPSSSGLSAEEAADRLAERLRRRTGLLFTGYLGEQVEGLKQLKHGYRTALDAMQFKFAYPEKRTFGYGRLKGEELRRLEFEPAEYARLQEQIEDADPDKRNAGIEWIFDQFRSKRYTPDAVHNAVNRFVFGAIGTIRSLQGDEKELLSLDPILSWRDYPVSPCGLRELFRAFAEESSEMASRLRKSNAKGDIVKIKQYIDSRYNEDISLKSIAARFYMNPVYLGQLFKKNYGVYFNDYLLQLRVHNAKKLLRQTEMRVYEVARSVGFDNPDYFICKFEKVEGKSPTSYRNELLAKT